MTPRVGADPNQPFRLPTGGLIDRDQPCRATFDGTPVAGYRGDTLASALLAAGIHQVTDSITYGRPRGIYGAWAEDATAQVGIEAPYYEPMVPAPTVELCDGLAARGVVGKGSLTDQPDTARYDAIHHHPDVLVVGAGAAGLMAALAVARRGVRVMLVDDRPAPGGATPWASWVNEAVSEIDGYGSGAVRLMRTTAFGAYDDGFVLAVERRTDHLGADAPTYTSRQRIHRIRARQIVIATGAHERPIAFADNDRPGIMLAAAAADYLQRYAVLPGRVGVVHTVGDSAYDAAFDLADAGVSIEAILDVRDTVADDLRHAAQRRGIEIRTATHVVGTDTTAAGGDEPSGDQPSSDGRIAVVHCSDGRSIAVDHLLVSGGWNPAVHLYSQRGGPLRFDDALGAFLPDTTAADAHLSNVHLAGAAAGFVHTGGCFTSGRRAGIAALVGLGRPARAARGVPLIAERVSAAPAICWQTPGMDAAAAAVAFVDLQRDATVADIRAALDVGMRSVEHVKRYTTIGTAHDQGKTSGILASGIVAEILGIPIHAAGVTTFRPPYTPVSFAALAGRDRGDLFDPVRTTSIHDWHVDRGAVFEDVGQWRRPRYYPQGGEDMAAAVARECAAVRDGVGILDGSTLGVIDVSGPDAAELLDRIYTNMMSTLRVGRIRYGLMCGVDGMVTDDGTVLRLAQDRYLLYTTTSGAAAVLDWLEEWCQTEWPELRVSTTSVTDHWATFPVVGPRSREVIAAAFADLDTSAEAFEFMTFRDIEFAGVPVRVARISFSGELAFEVNVDARYGAWMWQQLLNAGAEHAITPYGTETMHVLRAEKGYPIIGQDTDGTVSPHDLGMGWAVSKKKPDFLGRRSFARPANADPDRKQLVGLLPCDATTLLPEGSQVIAAEHTAAEVSQKVATRTPVPMVGHVTSSYRSAALGRTFALALLSGGRDRVGERLLVPFGDTLCEVEVTSPVFVDPEGSRRDG